MLGRVRHRLTYANAMATVAVFVALGGAAYAIQTNSVKSKHIAKNAVKGKDVKESSLRGIASGVLGGEVPNLNSAPPNLGFNPIGGWTGVNQNNTFVAPRKFVATRLRVRLEDPFTAGSRTVTFTRNVGQSDAELTALSCAITAPARTCRSNARVTYREGEIVAAELSSGGGPTGGDHLGFGWVALTP